MMSGDGSDLIHRYAERLKQQQSPAPAQPPAGPVPPSAPAPGAVPAGSPSPSAGSAKAPVAEPPNRPTVEASSPPARAAAPAPKPEVLAPPATPRRPPAASRSVKIDLRRLQRLGFITPQAAEKTLISEEFRLIKRPLIQKAFAKGEDALFNGNIIMVTSARPGEGKTFTAVNLALSIASERDLHVMLVDSDVYSQAALAALGLTAEKGLVDVLLDDEADLSDVMLRTNIPNLTVVPAGLKHPNATELLSSHRMTKLAEDVSARYPDRMVIIDSPPVLASSEPTVLASHVGQIVMVVEQNRTGWHLVERSLAQVESCHEISFVLNKVENKIWEENYSSRYRYQAKAVIE